jgi:hypothetical protein
VWSMPAHPPQHGNHGTHGEHAMDAMDAMDAELEEGGDHGRLPYPDDDDPDPGRFTR